MEMDRRDRPGPECLKAKTEANKSPQEQPKTAVPPSIHSR